MDFEECLDDSGERWFSQPRMFQLKQPWLARWVVKSSQATVSDVELVDEDLDLEELGGHKGKLCGNW